MINIFIKAEKSFLIFKLYLIDIHFRKNDFWINI